MKVISDLKLFEIPAALNNLLDLVTVNEETGEIECATSAAITLAAEDKLVGTALYVRRLEALIKATKEAEATLKARRVADEKKVEFLKGLMSQGMDSLCLEEIKAPAVTIKFRNNPESVVVDDESLVPADYIRTKTVTEVNKTAVKEAIKNGTDIQGCHLESKRVLKVA